MTFRSRTSKTVTMVLAVAALGAPTAYATTMTPRERQVIASRGVGAPYPKVAAAPPAVAARTAHALDTARSKSSGGLSSGAVAAIVAGALAACVALLAAARRHSAATPR